MKRTPLLCIFSLLFSIARAQNGMLVFQTDFGLKDGAVSEMKGVAMQVDPGLKLFDLTHEIPAFNTWEAAYRLQQTVRYWPKGTVFISVIDPGVGTSRKGVVLRTKSGHYIVSPDNGSLTLVAESLGISGVREIDEKINRLPGSGDSHTFHGRDVFTYTAARLASKKITWEQVGPLLPPQVIRLPYQAATVDRGRIRGNIPILDVQYGNVWTNIPEQLIEQTGIHYKDTVNVLIYEGTQLKYSGNVPFEKTFDNVPDKQPLCYINSLLNFSLALNMADFAKKYGVGSGADWTIEIRKQGGR
ncbi:MAG: S-adenosyl-l-methionine hydroxide adenosyltransferase family protein [Bacteroidetes bacterium]|nr:S-adenosyl-l-methionine hydroxide adenosyltransferase family protein [Bacteroidota bacterium]